MLSLQNNADRIVDSVRNNTVVLVATEAGATVEHYLAAGQVLMDLLSDGARLQPSYWNADGNEAPHTIKALDSMGRLTKKLYFSVQFEPGIDLSTAVSQMRDSDVAAQADRLHCWVDAFLLIRPTDEFVIGVGRWLYSIRAGVCECAKYAGTDAPIWTPSSINAS